MQEKINLKEDKTKKKLFYFSYFTVSPFSSGDKNAAHCG